MIKMQAAYEHDEIAIPLDAWEVRHLFSVWLAVALAIFAAFWGRGDAWLTGALVYTLMAGGAIAFAHVFRLLIYDSLLQFQYREKFGLFVFHMLVLAVPWMIGFKGWHHALSALLVTLCVQAVHILGMGRIYTVTALLGMSALLAPPYPSPALTAGWMFFLLMAMRADHVRFRLERFGTRQALPRREAIRATMRSVVLPWALALPVLMLTLWFFRGHTRKLEFDDGITRGGAVSQVGAVSVSEVIWDGIILAGLIIAALLMLHYLQTKLRGKQKASVNQGETKLQVAEEFESLAPPVFDSQVEDAARDPRGRILAGFKRFARNFDKLGWGRRDEETPREFFDRLAKAHLQSETVPGPLPLQFNRACYSEEEIAEADAVEFLVNLDRIEPIMRERIASSERQKKESGQ